MNNLIKAIGWSILHSLWQGAIIFILLFIVFAIHKKMKADLKHNLAIGALFLIFVSFCLTFAALFSMPTKSTNATATLELESAALQQLYHFTNSWSFKTESYFPFIVALYVAGIGFQLIVLTSSYLKLKQLKHTYISAMPNEWLNVAQETIAKLGITKKVKCYLSEKVNVPLAVGFLKPVVLFPIGLVAQLDIKQVEAILIHELSHIRRNDYILNLMKTGIETVLFFNPFVWLTSRFIQIEREHACDDLVVKFTNSPITYAHALLKLELLKENRTPALSLAATGKNQHLYQRIKRITDMKTSYMNAQQKILALCLTLATLISLAWINPNRTDKTVAKKPTKIANVSTLIHNTEIFKQLNKICLKPDTDTVRKIKRSIVVKSKDGKRTVYTSVDEMPDSLKIKLSDLEKTINSPEWTEKLAKIELNGLEMSKLSDSKELDKMFNAKEWKDNIVKIELNAKELEKKFNSPEWKEKMAKLEKHSLEMSKKFDSKEWKDMMAKLERSSIELQKKFDSPEWKEKMELLQKRSLDISEKFNSPEWKKKMEDLKELQNSKEYKELREKYEKDLEELKKKKGLTTEKAFLLYEGGLPMQIAALPSLPAAAPQRFFVEKPSKMVQLKELELTEKQ